MNRGLGRVVIALGMVLALVALSMSAAEARTDNRSKPVVYIHGYNPFGDGTDCNMWSSTNEMSVKKSAPKTAP